MDSRRSEISPRSTAASPMHSGAATAFTHVAFPGRPQAYKLMTLPHAVREQSLQYFRLDRFLENRYTTKSIVNRIRLVTGDEGERHAAR
jgi:hypothetical protein